jgi:uncharacterized membrane protein
MLQQFVEEPQEMAARATQEPTDRTGLERIVFFSDAVFAIAITLLVIEIRLPELAATARDRELATVLLALWPRYLSYAISFVVIGSFWVSHHGLFRHVEGYDGGLIWLNLLFLLFVAFTPFPTMVLGRMGITRLAQMVYAAFLGTTGLIKLLMYLYVRGRPRLLKRNLNRRDLRPEVVMSTVTPLAFLVSITLALLHPAAPVAVWSAPLLVFAILRAVGTRRARRKVGGRGGPQRSRD